MLYQFYNPGNPDEVIEREFSMAEKPETVTENGTVYRTLISSKVKIRIPYRFATTDNPIRPKKPAHRKLFY